MNCKEELKRYVEKCRETFWQKVFQVETEYLAAHLQGCHDILSVGCGPAMIEGALAEKGYHITGLDISEEALKCAPDSIRTIAGRAEEMSFPESSFDAVIFVASLQFIENYPGALDRAAAVLKPEGKIVIMLLNPLSEFYKEMRRKPDSYVNLIRHTDLHQIENDVRRNFAINMEYVLGIKGEDIFPSRDPFSAALYVITGRKHKKLSKR